MRATGGPVCKMTETRRKARFGGHTITELPSDPSVAGRCRPLAPVSYPAMTAGSPGRRSLRPNRSHANFETGTIEHDLFNLKRNRPQSPDRHPGPRAGVTISVSDRNAVLSERIVLQPGFQPPTMFRNVIARFVHPFSIGDELQAIRFLGGILARQAGRRRTGLAKASPKTSGIASTQRRPQNYPNGRQCK